MSIDELSANVATCCICCMLRWEPTAAGSGECVDVLGHGVTQARSADRYAYSYDLNSYGHGVTQAGSADRYAYSYDLNRYGHGVTQARSADRYAHWSGCRMLLIDL